MKTCEEHAWLIYDLVDPVHDLDTGQGFFRLTCINCRQSARVYGPTSAEIAEAYGCWNNQQNLYWGDDTDDARFAFLYGTPTAGDDDNIDSVGTMGWLPVAADNWQAHEFDHLGAATPTSCNHYWHVGGIIGQGTDGAEIELQCARCHEYATVLHVTDDECETIAKAWSMGMALEWQDARRLTLYRDLQRPPVADLVDRLDLFETDEGDDDVPF